MHGSGMKNPSQRRRTISETKDGHFCELNPSFQFSSTAMEGMTKWDPVSLKTSDEGQHIYSQMKLLDQKDSIVSAFEAELEQAHVRIQELETERHSSKKKLEHFLKKVSEERASWRSKEHEKICAYVEDIKLDLNRERKSRQRIEIINPRSPILFHNILSCIIMCIYRPKDHHGPSYFNHQIAHNLDPKVIT